MVREHKAVAIVTHKGFLRELERGPLGQPEASEFANGEVRMYEVTWDENGMPATPATCLYSNASLCTLEMGNFPAAWTAPAALSSLPGRLGWLLSEFGDLRELPNVQVNRRQGGDNGSVSPAASSDGEIVAKAVFSEQRAAAAAARKLHDFDNRTEAEKRARPTPHESDRFWARVLYDAEQARWPDTRKS